MIDPPTLERLVKFCGRFGSDQAGERATAAAMADMLVRDAGTTWEVLLRRPTATTVVATQTSGRIADLAGDLLRAHQPELTAWEISFLFDLSKWRGPGSDKQRAQLQKISGRFGK